VRRAYFAGTARIASGAVPTRAVAAYDVRVQRGRLRLAAHGSTGVVLDVPLDRVDVRPVGRAGTAVVEVDGTPLLIDLSQRLGSGPRGRWLRRRFMSALRGGRR
jgi:hypothetical protein